MEEAYTALYQEFLRLQLLCLKQAEMLQQLIEALRKQGVAPVFNGNFEDLYSEPFQYRCEGLGMFTHAEDQAQAAHIPKQEAHTHTPVGHTHTPAAHTHIPAAHTHTPVGHTHIPAGLTHACAAHTHIPAGHTHTRAAHTHIAAGHKQTPAVQPTGITGDSVVSPLAGALNRLHLEPLPEKVEDEGAAAASGRCEMGEHSILDELRQVEQRWHSSQIPKQQQQHQRRPWSSSFLTSEMLSEAGGMLMSHVTLHSQVCEFCHAVFPGHTTTRGEFLRHLTAHIS